MRTREIAPSEDKPFSLRLRKSYNETRRSSNFTRRSAEYCQILRDMIWYDNAQHRNLAWHLSCGRRIGDLNPVNSTFYDQLTSMYRYVVVLIRPERPKTPGCRKIQSSLKEGVPRRTFAKVDVIAFLSSQRVEVGKQGNRVLWAILRGIGKDQRGMYASFCYPHNSLPLLSQTQIFFGW